MVPRNGLAIALVAGLAIMPAAFIESAGAQSICAPASHALEPGLENTAPLMQRRITLHGRAVSLRDALDRLAAAAGIHLSYSAESLDLSKSVCIEYQSVAIGRILNDLIGDAGVRAVVLGTDQIVLTPSPRESASIDSSPIMKQVGILDRVIVTGSTVGASERALPIALDVVSGDQLSQRGATTISGALDGVVPGLWLWEQSPLSMLARYGSIRGSSSFGVSYPKVYVDGVEVANSLLVTHLDPASISRIEVIRGPQGAALYGADAISGVMNIVTNQQGLEAGSPRAQIQTEGGASASDYSPGSVLIQSHAISLRTGNNAKSARAGMTISTIGAFIPGASSQQVSANGGMRFVRSRGVVTGTFRFFAQDAHTPANPLVDFVPTDTSDRQSVRQYTLGVNAVIAQSGRWTHSAVIGLDGYTLNGATESAGGFSSALDSALRAATGNALRTTLRASSVGQFGNTGKTAATVTIAAEHSFVRDETIPQTSLAPFTLARIDGPGSLVESRSNAGIIGEVSASYAETFFLSGGLRVERNSGLNGIGDIATLPMLGGAVVHAIGPNTFKLRAAYGKGIRPPENSNRAGAIIGLNGTVDPEQQSGIEAGADIFFGKYAAIHATRFNQRASGLIQPVGVYATSINDSMPHFRRVVYELQNVGEISNRGWEFQGSVGDGPWSLGATFSQVDSRVRKLADRYTGDLLPGDRMLEVPATTLGLNAMYAHSRWSMAWRVSRASDWVNYDRLLLLRTAATAGADPQDLVGSSLRSYWRNYSGVTRLGARVGMNVSKGMTLTLDGENLLDEQRGEPDNITVLPGRTISAGLRVSF